jgi:benzoyl-CoA reductase/2-hydroxyglutaryl-CoA dehydratase subunit BcrC/BadD/HgdB
MASVDPDDENIDGVKEEDLWRVEYLANEMRESFQAVQQELGIKVPDETLMEAHEAWRNRAIRMAELGELLMATPKPVGGVSTSLFNLIPGLHFNVDSGYMNKAMDITIQELKKRVANTEGILPEGTPKLMNLMGTDTLPWIVKMFEDNGVRYQHPMFMPKQAAPPSYDDPFMATAEAHIRGGNDTGSEFAHICRDLKLWGADGMVFGFYDFDRYLGGHQRLLARMVEERTGIPTFYVEGNAWEDRDYTPEALRTKIESICEILKMRKR